MVVDPGLVAYIMRHTRIQIVDFDRQYAPDKNVTSLPACWMRIPIRYHESLNAERASSTGTGIVTGTCCLSDA